MPINGKGRHHDNYFYPFIVLLCRNLVLGHLHVQICKKGGKPEESASIALAGYLNSHHYLCSYGMDQLLIAHIAMRLTKSQDLNKLGK